MTRPDMFYAVRQTRRPKLVGSRRMRLADAEREVRVWAREIGPAAVVPASPEAEAASRTYDQAVLGRLLSEYQTKGEGR